MTTSCDSTKNCDETLVSIDQEMSEDMLEAWYVKLLINYSLIQEALVMYSSQTVLQQELSSVKK